MNEDELKKNETVAEDGEKKDTCAGCPNNPANKENKEEPEAPPVSDEQVRAAVRSCLDSMGGNLRSFSIKSGRENTQKYSLTRAFQSLLDPSVGKYEREVSNEMMRAAGMSGNSRSGLMLSFRDFTGAEGSGNGLIGTDHRADLFVRALRTRMGVKKIIEATCEGARGAVGVGVSCVIIGVIIGATYAINYFCNKASK